MDVKGWKYYNHAAIPSTAPHEEPRLLPIEDKSIWKITGTPLLARWTTDFDCGYDTNWWYVIKDTPMDLAGLTSNYRYKINKGIKHFDVREINPIEYSEELYRVFRAAFDSWPKRYRPNFTYDAGKELFQELSDNPSMVCYGAFYKETEELCGFMQVPTYESYAELQVQRVNPLYEKYQINAALVHHLLESNRAKLSEGNFYILDGARSISHETKFQDYLEKYFCFRKAYCRFHIAYNPKIEKLIKILYPFKGVLRYFDGLGIIHQVNSVLKMEEIRRGEDSGK